VHSGDEVNYWYRGPTIAIEPTSRGGGTMHNSSQRKVRAAVAIDPGRVFQKRDTVSRVVAQPPLSWTWFVPGNTGATTRREK
jgi:hypothetical protein